MYRFTLLSFSIFALASACGDDDEQSSDDDTSSSGASLDTSSSSGGSSSSESTTDIDPTVEPESSTGEPATCDVSTQLTWVRDTIVVSSDPCSGWIDDTHGRVGKLGSASATMWTRRTFYGTGIAISAAHLLGEGAFGLPDTDIPAQLVDPTMSPPTLGAVYPDTNGSGNLKQTYSATFQLFNPEIPAAESGKMLANILPRHDFYLTVVDGQNLPVDREPAPVPEPLMDSPPQLYDPNNHSVESPTLANVDAGELVALIGAPIEGQYEGLMVSSIGRVLDDTEAEAAIAELAAGSDPAGDLPYDPEAEFLVEAVFSAGMLGGGVFDDDRIHVGVTVRASESEAEDDPKYIRVVRTPFIAEQLQAAYDALDPEMQETIGVYLEAE